MINKRGVERSVGSLVNIIAVGHRKKMRRRHRRLVVKVLTGLLTAYCMSKKKLFPTSFSFREFGHFSSLFIKAATALTTLAVAAAAATRPSSSSEKVERMRPADLPSESTLRAHLHTYTTNLARALELKRTKGDLTRSQNQLLTKKFQEMRETIRMTENLLQHLTSQSQPSFS